MSMGISDITTKMIGDKRRWRAYKARTKLLPDNYRTVVDALERYAMYFGPVDGDSAASLYEDLADIFERAAADETPIRAIVGEDPIEFIDSLIHNYSRGGYIKREQDRLLEAITLAEGGES